MHQLEKITTEITLSEALQTGHDILSGGVRGRVVVNVNA
jgi:hypothetical protein